MTKQLSTGHYVELGLWAPELVVFAIFAFQCLPRRNVARARGWFSSRLMLAFVALLPVLAIAWVRLDDLYDRPPFADAEDAKARISQVRDMFYAGATIFSTMLGMHTLAWLATSRLRHKEPHLHNLQSTSP